MKRWLFLAGAIVTEVAATLSLRASVDHPGWLVLVVAGYASAFALLALTLRAGAALGTAYGTWSACGVGLVALLGVAIFGETLTVVQVLGIALLIVGVVVVETGSSPAHGAGERIGGGS
ncbi:DMT family transporter [Microbacterium halophytorum]|uniref:DMT family transporter n=1 Tax=Microbacterium halophytorum TaxID=2067568 RepID=UPI000CFD33DF|nr:SMR family transporter [Microbacterium halophytorum]